MAQSAGLANSGIQDLDYGGIFLSSHRVSYLVFQGRIEMTNLEGKVSEIRLSRVNWQSYLQ